MAAQVVKRIGNKLVIEVELDLSAESMLDKEEAIREAVNLAGSLGTVEALKSFDTKGEPILVDGVKQTSKGECAETYECPYGDVIVARHVYQTSKGGKTFCPLENDARLILNSTPAYAKIISFKYAQNGGNAVARDMLESNGRKVCPVYVKKVSDFVGEVAQYSGQDWTFSMPELSDEVASVSVGVDGTCVQMVESGWREAMTGTIGFFDKQGERLHTMYFGAAPEYGKATFFEKMGAEVIKVKELFPSSVYIGLADGAPENWKFLEPLTGRSVLDFYHAAEYVKLAANAIHPGSRNKKDRGDWLADRLHRLKHKHGAAKRLLNELEEELMYVQQKHVEDLEKAATYFRNNYRRMNYARQVKENMPIGSGVTEAACKELIKQRLCGSGMRWKDAGAAAVISIRSIRLTEGKWKQFWNNIIENGCPEHKIIEKL